MRRQFGREIDGAVASARAADGDGQVRFALPRESGDEEVDEPVQLALERLHLFVVTEEVDDVRMRAVERAQLVDIVRIRKEANVEDEIGIQWHAEFVAESDDRNREDAGFRR